jgi:hypothetical protein
MTDPKSVSPTDQDILDFSDAPGGDATLDDLFGSEPAITQPTTATNPDPSPAPATSQPAPTSDYYLDAGTSKYKTQEEAIRGLTHKDEVIEHLRGIAVQATGIDPLTGQKVAVPRTSQPSSPSMPGQPWQQGAQDDSYLNNPAKYSADLRDAVARNDEARYMQVQAKLAQEQVMQSFAPVVPMFQKFAVSQAVDSAVQKNADFRTFYGGADYAKALDANPILKAAIQNAEQTFEYQAQLPELYNLVYQVAQVQKMSELVKAQQTPSNPSPARPTTQPSNLTPPASSANPNSNWRSSPDAAKSLVEDYERKMGIR